jgi:hypothetical protein
LIEKKVLASLKAHGIQSDTDKRAIIEALYRDMKTREPGGYCKEKYKEAVLSIYHAFPSIKRTKRLHKSLKSSLRGKFYRYRKALSDSPAVTENQAKYTPKRHRKQLFENGH